VCEESFFHTVVEICDFWVSTDIYYQYIIFLCSFIKKVTVVKKRHNAAPV
jgi:hypothetical protein